MSDKKHHILLAEDDLHLGRLLTEYLEGEGFDITLCRDGEEALRAITTYPFQLCLLDVMMPKMDGFTLARRIRLHDPALPLLFITARSLKEDKLKGYGLGADDYITKPFDEEELLCRIRAILRRTAAPGTTARQRILTIGEYVLDVENQLLTRGGKSRRMTEKESLVLEYLAHHRNHLVRREVLLKELWGENDYFLGRSLDVFITKIRKYLKDDPMLIIENVFGVGFIFNVPEG